jgi:hypothetical protein
MACLLKLLKSKPQTRHILIIVNVLRSCIVAVKKLTHLKILQTFVEYQGHVEGRCDVMYFDNVLWYLGNHVHPKLDAFLCFVLCYCIFYVFCMLAWCVFLTQCCIDG